MIAKMHMACGKFRISFNQIIVNKDNEMKIKQKLNHNLFDSIIKELLLEHELGT